MSCYYDTREDDDCIIISSDDEEGVPNSNTFQAVDGTGDVAISSPTVNTKCPYTGKEMTNPVRNRWCKHRYDKDGILHHIRCRAGKARCPVGGCWNDQLPLIPSDLENDENLRNYIINKNAHEQMKRLAHALAVAVRRETQRRYISRAPQQPKRCQAAYSWRRR